MTHNRGTDSRLVWLTISSIVFTALACQQALGEHEPPPTSRPAPAATQPSTRPALPPPSTQPVQIDPHITELIADLGSEDVAARDRAGERLLECGPAALVALGRAARYSDEPEIVLRAKRLLAKIDWALPTDPRSVTGALKQYGSQSVDQRRRVVRVLARYVGPDSRPAWQAMGRIVQFDPSDDVQWEVVRQVRIRPNTGGDIGLVAVVIRYASPATKALIARNNLGGAPQLAVNLFLKSLQEDARARRPAQDRTEILFAIRDLLRLARQTNGQLRGAALIRQQFPLAAENQRAWLNRELYALYASGGSLGHLADDIARFPPNLSDIATLYAVAELERRIGYVNLADRLEQRAFDAPRLMHPSLDKFASFAEITARMDAADFLGEHKMHAAAERELNEIARVAPDNAELARINAHLRLRTICVESHRDREAGDHLQSALGLMEKSDLKLHISTEGSIYLPDAKQNCAVMMHRDYLHAAKKSHDIGGILDHSIAIALLRPIDEPILLEVYPLLKQNGHDAEAQSLFGANFDKAKERLAAVGPEPDGLSRLTRICTRCGQHPIEAQAYARQASEMEPWNPAMQALVADVEYHAGHFEQAIAAQEKAVKLAPTVRLYKNNLEVFRMAQARAAVHDISTPPPADDKPQPK